MNKTRLPEIVIGQSEHASLTSLATEAEDRLPGVAEALLNELDRARIVGRQRRPRSDCLFPNLSRSRGAPAL